MVTAGTSSDAGIGAFLGKAEKGKDKGKPKGGKKGDGKSWWQEDKGGKPKGGKKSDGKGCARSANYWASTASTTKGGKSAKGQEAAP